MIVRISVIAAVLGILLASGSVRASSLISGPVGSGEKPATGVTTPSGSAGGLFQGDVNCDATVSSVDSLQILRSVAGLSTSAACLSDAGDVNCDGASNAVDSLLILRFVAGFQVTAPDSCVAIGEALTPPPTSEELIAEALDADEITYEDSLLYRALALYDLPGLPDEFRSPVIDIEAAIPLAGEIEENRATLSQQTLDDLAPIMARPNDPISIFNNPPAQAASASSGPAATWRSRAVQFTNVRVWVKATSDAPLNTYEVAVAQVWPELEQVFGLPRPDKVASPATDVNPDTRIDIYFAPMADVDPRNPACTNGCTLEGANGLSWPTDLEANNTSSAHIQIRDTLTGDYLLKVIAHELAHAVQFLYDFREDFWLMDSTADWAGFRVLQELGTATRANLYDRAKIIIDNYDKPLSRDVGESRYAAWLYFFFASMDQGDGIVKSVWEKAAAPGKQREKAADEAFPFDDWFDNFTVRNWNQDPVDPMYGTEPPGDATYPGSLRPKIPATRNLKLQGNTGHTIVEAPEKLSALYYRYTFDDGVRNVAFHPLLQGNPHAHIWGIVKIGDEWQAPEDWSGVEDKRYCRDIEDENITEAIIVLSNSDMAAKLPGGPKLNVEVAQIGCPGYAGWARATIRVFDELQDITYTSNQVNLRFEARAVQEVPENVQYDLASADPLIWTASGTYDGCPVSGQATVVLPAGPYQPGLTAGGYLNVFSLTDNHFIVIIGLAFADATVTCPGDPPNIFEIPIDAGYLLHIVSEPNTHEGGVTVLKGHQKQPPDLPLPEGLYQEFEWELRPVGSGP